MSSATPPVTMPSSAAEAARYALLRRLAPSMRHHLVVNLQPIGMIYEVMDRRLRAPAPDLANVHESAGKINGFAKAALTACVDVVGWLAADEAAGITLAEAARECSALLATSFSFRGYALRNEVGAVPGTVRRAAIRNLLTGALLHVTDHQPAPADLVLTCTPQAEAAVVSIAFRPTPSDKAIAAEANYRRITWDDVQALAQADGAAVTREGQGLVLRFPWVERP